MILLAFLSFFLVFFFVKDQIASFQFKQISVFVSVCVFISLRDGRFYTRGRIIRPDG